jgi:hypothetical protein
LSINAAASPADHDRARPQSVYRMAQRTAPDGREKSRIGSSRMSEAL